MKLIEKENVIIKDLGLKNYNEILKMQHNIVSQMINGFGKDFLLLVEHPPTYTIGRNGSKENIIVPENTLKDEGIKLHEISRGGDIIYHGPGQIVGYPILDLQDHKKDLHWYLDRLEEVFLNLFKEQFEIDSVHKIEDLTGVWVNDKKVVFIGIGAKKWITYHGFAFNVKPEMKYFDYIIPCGIKDRGITSLSELQPDKNFNNSRIKKLIANYFCEVFYS